MTKRVAHPVMLLLLPLPSAVCTWLYPGRLPNGSKKRQTEGTVASNCCSWTARGWWWFYNRVTKLNSFLSSFLHCSLRLVSFISSFLPFLNLSCTCRVSGFSLFCFCIDSVLSLSRLSLFYIVFFYFLPTTLFFSCLCLVYALAVSRCIVFVCLSLVSLYCLCLVSITSQSGLFRIFLSFEHSDYPISRTRTTMSTCFSK